MTPRSPDDAPPPKRMPAGSNPAEGTNIVALYLRISEDRKGEQVAVSRQREECRALAERLGLTISREYVDNDVSATSGAIRPEFERMLSDRPAAIIAWHQDRLLRLTRDLERVIELDVPVYTVTAGTMDLSTPAGRAVARTVAAWSQYEGEQKAIRQRAKNAQQLRNGIPLRGIRPFGFEVDRIEIREAEAVLIQEAAQTILDGGTLYEIVTRLNAAGVPTTRGGRWSYATVRQMLLRPRNAGLLESHGVLLRDDLPAILSLADFEAVRAILTDPRRETAPGPKVTKAMMAGLAHCGVCGAPMRSGTAGAKERRQLVYRCAGRQMGRATGERHAQIDRHVLERPIAEAVYSALVDLSLDGALIDADSAPQIGALMAARIETERKRGVAQDLLYSPDVDAARVRRQLAEFAAEIKRLDAEIVAASQANATDAALASVRWLADGILSAARGERRPGIAEISRGLGLWERFSAEWAQMPLEARRDLIRVTITVKVNPAHRTARHKFALVPDGPAGHVEFVTTREGKPRIEITPQRRSKP